MVITPDAVVVVDGAGLPESLRAGCSHSVAWFAQSIAVAFHAALTTRSGTMAEGLADAITRVADSHSSICDLEAGSPSATVAAWRYAEDVLEYLVLCDASLVVVDQRGRATHLTDLRLQQAVDAATKDLTDHGDGDRTTAEIRRLARIRVEAIRNREGGWWCVNSDPRAADRALTGAVNPDGLSGIVACSDGASRAFDLLSTHTVDRFADLCLNGSVESVAGAIRQAEERRADALQGQGIKTHDDLTVVGARFR